MSVTPQSDTAPSEARQDDLGPINVVVLAYPPGAPMTGEAAPILPDLVDRGITDRLLRLLRRAFLG